MIARLTGTCVHLDETTMVLDVAGVGYLVHATTRVLQAAARAPEQVTVHVHTNVRDDAIQLYGFGSRGELRAWERLVQLQGVGPKVATAVLGALEPAELRRAAQAEDVKLLQSVPGVGPKVARRIVTELADHLDDLAPSATTTLGAKVTDGDDASGEDAATAAFYEAREALVGLGMSVAEADLALQSTDQAATAADRVRQALAGGGTVTR